MAGLLPPNGTGRTYFMPSVGISRPQFSIQVPRLPDEGDPEPETEPTESPTEPKLNTGEVNNVKVTTPKTVSNPGSSNLWGSVAKDVGIGAGALGSIGAGAYNLAKTGASDIGHTAADLGDEGLEIAQPLEGSVINPSRYAPEISNISSKVINGADYNVLQPTEALASNAPKALGMNANWGEEMANGLNGLGKMASSAVKNVGMQNGTDLGSAADSSSSGLTIPDSWASIGEDASELAPDLLDLAG